MRDMAFPAPSPATTTHTSAPINKSLKIHRYSKTKKKRRKKRTLPISIQLANHHIGRMADDRAANTGNIPAQETDPSLLQRIVALLRLPERRIDIIDRRLERRELNHRIRDLPSPKRIQPLIQTPDALLLRHLPPPFPQRARERRDRRLHPYLDGLEGAEGEVGEEFGGCGRREVDDCFVGVGEESVAVGVLE